MKRRNVLASGFLFTAVALNCFGAEIGKYYTQVNIWYEHPQKIYNTNYHMGQILPVGSEVEVIAMNKDKIRFKDQKSGVEFLLIQNPKHYWENRFKRKQVTFSDGKVSNIL